MAENYTGFVHHHIVNRVNGGGDSVNNKLLMKWRREKLWHLLFGNDDIDSVVEKLEKLNDPELWRVIDILKRVSRAKKAQAKK